MAQRSITDIIQENKTVFIIIAIIVLLLEIEIFAMSAMKSGKKSRLQILDKNGTVIHETNGSDLSSFNKYYFEKTFGPLDQYEVRLKTEEVPFPFRAWFTAAIGIPVGGILLFGFIVRAYLSIFHGNLKFDDTSENREETAKNRGEKFLSRISRFNIFIIGFLIFIAVFAYWVIPNFLVYVGKTGVETIVRFKWFFIPAAVVVGGVFIWMIYLRYLLAKRAIDSQVEVEKYRLQIELAKTNGQTLLPPSPTDRQLTWDRAQHTQSSGPTT